MSLHNNPKYNSVEIHNALKLHGFQPDAPSQLADAFRLGYVFAKKPKIEYTTGHCLEKAKPGGCQLHNLHCGYPTCDRKENE